MKKYKIAFFGTPAFTTQFLDLFISEKCKEFLDLNLIVTGEDKPVGRGMQMESPEPKKWAVNPHPSAIASVISRKNGLEHSKLKHLQIENLKKNIEVLQPKKLDEELFKILKDKNFDLFIVIAYGKIIPEKFINLPKYGTINLHYSLLPKYRGASPVESAILNNEKETGITIQQMQFELDAGNILFQERIEILKNETTTELRNKLNKRAIEIFPEFLNNFFNKKTNGIPQIQNEATFCKKIKKEEMNVTEILFNKNLNKQKIMEMIFTKWKAFDKKIFFFINKNQKQLRIRITEMQVNKENNEIEILKLLPESKKEISLKDFENSYYKI